MPRADFSKLDILVVDPSPHMASLIGQMLRHIRVRSVAEAHDSDKAALLLHSHRFGVIMMNDILLPMNGLSLVKALRQAPEGLNCHTAVIMMSSEPDAAEVAAARDAGVTEFLRKPFAAQHVAGRLEAILGAPRPFVQGGGFAGPDRRRRRADYKGTERRGQG